MKKLLLSIIMISGVCLIANAQTFVSTTAEMKNAVLEEFTGIYCTYCPDGHKRAQQLADDNPGDVVLINIHVGGYAAPSGSDPDFRTPFGTAIKDQALLTGYPSGTINRHNFSSQGWDDNGGTAMSRSYWDDGAAVMLLESSYVNIAAESTIDYTTRVLTVNVEAHYTANGPSSNNINVALLQHNIAGPQTGASSYNPDQILPSGEYNHGHMLRHMLTGQWGAVTTATTSGTTYTQTFTYTIPADLNGVAYELFDLSVAVFIAEGQQEIISGSNSSMDYILPPGITLVDLGASTNMTVPADYCDGNVTPEITVMNNSTSSVDTFEVSYVLDGGTPVTLVGNNLAASASVTMPFPAIVLASGSHLISYNVNTDNAVSIIDNISSNNNANSGVINTISPVAFGQSHSEGFESYNSGGSVINNAILINSSSENTYVVSNAVSGNVTWPLGAFENSDMAWRMRFYSWDPASEATLLFENIDLSTNTGNGLRFSYAQAQASTSNVDKLEVMASTDCGATWTTVYIEQGAALATSTPLSSAYFYPVAADWDSVNIDLGAFDGQSSVMIQFKGTAGGGNNLYFDDIAISNTVDLSNPYVLSTGLAEVSNSIFEAAELYPNPANEVAFVKLQMKKSAEVKVEVRNMIGQVVDLVSSVVLSAGSHTLTIDTSEFGEGLYFVNIYTGEDSITKKFVVTK
ncbi:MAG: hypothetical protein COB85_04775 [Bacteroidetes bacterium]|nr:MAG: hypothetical protein COB85_04775 [Bacteroidota bacterium]